MLNQFSRTQLLLGESAMQELANKRVAVFGIGGVGGYACEALVRSGIGAFDLIDDDKVCLTNLNRQIIATRKTVGKYKYYFSKSSGIILHETSTSLTPPIVPLFTISKRCSKAGKNKVFTASNNTRFLCFAKVNACRASCTERNAGLSHNT